jgi:monoamine oxidase
VPGLYLAGAWTDTGWPATMEGAVRSGTAAVDAVLADLGAAPEAGAVRGPRREPVVA